MDKFILRRLKKVIRTVSVFMGERQLKTGRTMSIIRPVKAIIIKRILLQFMLYLKATVNRDDDDEFENLTGTKIMGLIYQIIYL